MMGSDNSFLLFIGAIFLCLFALFSPFFIIGALIAAYKGIKIMLHNNKIDQKAKQYVLVYYRLKDVDYSEKRYTRIYNLPEFEKLEYSISDGCGCTAGCGSWMVLHYKNGFSSHKIQISGCTRICILSQAVTNADMLRNDIGYKRCEEMCHQ